VKQKLTLLFLSIIGTTALAYSQEDSYKTLLKRSSVSIHAAQKHMLATKKMDMNGDLAKAVLLQSYAVKLYKEKKEAQAACSSLQARNLAFNIIKAASAREDKYAQPTDDEKKLAGSCKAEEELLKESRKSLTTLSEKDESYKDPKSLNETNIDIK
jgi:hypothetical protein